MATLHVAAEGAMGVPATVVYRCIADYRTHHPRMVPPALSDFFVEAGGVGAGTVVRYKLNLAGRTSTARMRVTEPEPGRVLVESDMERDLVTTFTVTPEGAGCRVRIETIWQPVRGLEGIMERLFAPRLLRSLYADELNRFDQYARALGAS